MKGRGREGVRLGLRVKWGISRGDGGRGRSLNIVLINPTRDYVFFICINSDHSCKACKDLEAIFEEIIKKSTKCFA